MRWAWQLLLLVPEGTPRAQHFRLRRASSKLGFHGETSPGCQQRGWGTMELVWWSKKQGQLELLSVHTHAHIYTGSEPTSPPRSPASCLGQAPLSFLSSFQILCHPSDLCPAAFLLQMATLHVNTYGGLLPRIHKHKTVTYRWIKISQPFPEIQYATFFL